MDKPTIDFPYEQVVNGAIEIILREHREEHGTEAEFPDFFCPNLIGLNIRHIGPNTHTEFPDDPIVQTLIAATYKAIFAIVQVSHPELKSCTVSFLESHIRRILSGIVQGLKFQPVKEDVLESPQEIRREIQDLRQERYGLLLEFFSSRDDDEKCFTLLGQIEQCGVKLGILRNRVGLGAPSGDIPTFSEAVGFDLQRETILQKYFDPSPSERALLQYLPFLAITEAYLFHFSFYRDESGDDIGGENIGADEKRYMQRLSFERKMLVASYGYRFLLMARMSTTLDHSSTAISSEIISEFELHLKELLSEIDVLKLSISDDLVVGKNNYAPYHFSVADNDLFDLSSRCENLIGRLGEEPVPEFLQSLSDILSDFSVHAYAIHQQNGIYYHTKETSMAQLRSDLRYSLIAFRHTLPAKISENEELLVQVVQICEEAITLFN